MSDIPSGYSSYLEKLIREIWERKALEQGYDPELIKAYGERLSQAIDKGYTIEEDFSTVDERKIHAIKSNVWQFSTAKTYTQLKQMSDALLRPDGTIRSFEEFRIQTAIITGKQLRHLKTEYQTALAGAQMASHWEQIQRTKKSYPYLQFVAIEDDHTSALCRSLDGVIRLVDDAFWMQFYPPNHYNCRSRVKQLRKGDITPDDQIVKPNIPDIFKVNLGERGLAFPEDHAYFEDMPIEVYQEAKRFFPYAMQFDILDPQDDMIGLVRQHYLVNPKAKDYPLVKTIAEEFAKKQKINTDLLPELDNTAQRAIIYPDSKVGKNPDLRIDRVLYDVKTVSSTKYNTIRNAIDKGYKQVNNIIIDLPSELSIQEMWRIAKGRFMDHSELASIHFRFNGQYYLTTREDMFPRLIK